MTAPATRHTSALTSSATPQAVTSAPDASPAPAPEVVVVSQGPDHPWVGQAVRFDVQLVRPIEDVGAPPPFSFGEVTMPGAIARFQEQAPPPDERSSGDATLLVQHRTLLVFPQLDGELVLPPIIARWNEGETVVTAASQPTPIHAAYAPGSSEALVIAPSVRIEQTLSRPLSGLRVGEGFSRKVELTVTDSDPIVLPTLEFAQVPGLSVHSAAPRDVASAERGQITASRTFEATYVVERVGHYDLDALTVRWLEPASGKYHTASAPELAFWALPNPQLGLHMWGTATTNQLAGFGLSLALLLGFVTVVIRRTRGGPFAFERWLGARYAERRAYRRFVASLAGSSPLESLRLVYAWLRARFPSSTDRTLAPLRSVDAFTTESLAVLEDRAFNPGQERTAPAASVAALARVRTRLTRRVPSHFRLNPSGSETAPQPGNDP